ncbi:hypothetical protein RUND412_009144 [Rhizina undulata]
MSPSEKVWLITGCSSGFGKELTLEALSRGDKVIATGRDISRLHDVEAAGAFILKLDVSDAPEDITRVVQVEAMKVYGRIDILVNNAAYLSCGTLEEVTHEDTVNQFNTNLFGLLNVTRAVLPHFRSRREGAVINLSSVGGHVADPAIGNYCGTKFAIEGFSEALYDEVAPFDVKVLVVVPGHFRTDILDPEKNRTLFPKKFNEYDSVRASTVNLLAKFNGNQPGDTRKGVRAIVDLVNGERKWPRRLLLGSDAVQRVSGHLESILQEIKDWEEISRSCDYPKEM